VVAHRGRRRGGAWAVSKVQKRAGVFVVAGVAAVAETVMESAVFSVRCAHHGEHGAASGFLYPSSRGRRSDNRCPYCMRIENSRRPAERYLAQRVISYRSEHGDPTVAEIIEFAVKRGIACTHKHGNGKPCGSPMKTRTADGPRCARHAGQGR